MSEITPKKSRGKVGIIILVIMLIAALSASGFFYWKYQQASQDPRAQQQKTLQLIGKTLQLPDEDPTSFTISDKSKLTNQALASRVENNDVLFVYAKAKKLIIYRPSSQKVVDMLSIGSSADLGGSQKSSSAKKE